MARAAAPPRRASRTAAGCFWGSEKGIWRFPYGIYSTAVGYCAGFTPNPTYQEACSGLTGHTEGVRVVYDPKEISFSDILRWFWEAHDPTSGMGQGNDRGTQYRSGAYYVDAEQKALIEASKAAYALPAVTLTYDKDIDEYTTWDYLDLNEDGNVGSGEHQFNTARADDDQGIGVRLAWRLDKLVMSSERIRVINEAQDIVKLRDKVLDEVTRVYFDRRRLQVDQLLNPSSALRDQIKHELRLQELTASIDALTGGAFSAQLGG